ncbi:hypothetical protein BW716_07235 [[Flexibacter] sp. ATCC 35208]|nr:hypothetical protein BW716_07235 [[Flexibacter] sp. ATCC 35208]
MLTFHLDRHTFATTVCLKKGVLPEAVQKLLGHKYESQTVRSFLRVQYTLQNAQRKTQRV